MGMQQIYGVSSKLVVEQQHNDDLNGFHYGSKLNLLESGSRSFYHSNPSVGLILSKPGQHSQCKSQFRQQQQLSAETTFNGTQQISPGKLFIECKFMK